MAAKCDIFTYSSATDVSEVTLSNVDATDINLVSINIETAGDVSAKDFRNNTGTATKCSISGGKLLLGETVQSVTRIIVLQAG